MRAPHPFPLLQRPDAPPRRRAWRATAAAAALAAVLSWPPGPAAGQGAPVKIGAGEHDGFSRLVVNMAPPPGWRAEVTRGADGRAILEVRLPGVTRGFDGRAAGEARKAHRVTGFAAGREAGAAVLRFPLSCACAVRPRALSGALVLDLRPGAAEAPAPAAVAASAPSDAAAEDIETGSTPGGPAGLPAARDARIALVRRNLLEQLKRAEEQGLITFRDGAATPPGAADAETETETETETRNGPSLETGDAPAAADAAQKAAGQETAGRETAGQEATGQEAAEQDAAPAPLSAAALGAKILERALTAAPGPAEGDPADAGAPPAPSEERGDAPEETAVGEDPAAAPSSAPPAPAAMAACLPDAELDPALWRDRRPFADGLAARRRALIDRINRVDAAAVTALQAYYLSYGFTPESRMQPRAFRVADDPRAQLLKDVADALDGEPPRPESPFARAAPCPGWHGVWQAAALAEAAPDIAFQALEAGRVTLNFAPEPIRRIVGARLGRAAAAAGRSALAEDLLAMLSRNQDAPSADMRFLRAALLAEAGRVVAARRELRQVLQDRDPQAPRAMIRYAELLEAPTDRAAAARTAEELSDLALQYRGAPVWAELVAAEGALRARFEPVTAGLAVFERGLARAARGGPATAPAAQTIAEAKSAMLDFVVARAAEAPTPERLVEAVDLLTGTGDGPAADARRRRLARVLVENGAPKLVAVVLDDALRARDEEARAIYADARAASALPRLGPLRLETGDLSDVGLGADLAAEPDASEREDAGAAANAALLSAIERYLEGDSLPEDVKARLKSAETPAARAVSGLFTTPEPEPVDRPTARAPQLERGRSLLEAVDGEIQGFRELLQE